MNRLLPPALLIVAIAVVVAPRLDDRDQPAGEGAAAISSDAPLPERAQPATDAFGPQASIDRDASGQFHVDAEVEGTPVRFLVDTGADLVALAPDDAQRLGLMPDAGSFRPILRTASGTGYGAPVRIDRLVVADHELENVDAVVVRGLSVSLLGQSALRRLGPVSLDGDRLLIGG